jgi:hypothetical protein
MIKFLIESIDSINRVKVLDSGVWVEILDDLWACIDPDLEIFVTCVPEHCITIEKGYYLYYPITNEQKDELLEILCENGYKEIFEK